MVVIVSDFHLSDGTTGETVGYGAVNIFRDALRNLAYGGSWRRGGNYKPIEDLYLVLGDILDLDVIRPTQWLQVNGVLSSVRLLHDSNSQTFINKVKSITQALLGSNARSLATLKNLAQSITIPKVRVKREVYMPRQGATVYELY